jgi:hypothetical protein
MNVRLAPLILLAFFLKCEVNTPIDPVPRASSLTVVVIDGASHGVPGARVYLNGPRSMGVYGPSFASVTDGGGRCRFDDLESIPYLVVGAQSSATTAANTVTVPPPPSAAVNLRLALARAGALRGQVTLQGETDRGGILVTTLGLVAADTTDPSGGYSLAGIPAGAWRLVASKPGFASQEVVAEVATPGDTVTLPTLTLVPAPGSRP